MILVTGAAGFIGSAITKSLNTAGYKTITIDDLSTGYRENVPEDTIFIEGNCGDKIVIGKLDKYKISAIVHFAGQSSGEISFKNPLEDQKSNTTSTLLLLKYAKDKGIKKMIYASSMSVYGDHLRLPVNEDSVTLPKSFYAVGKLASEHYLKLFACEDLQTVALRLFNVYGPGQNLANLNQGMLSIYLAQALRDQKIVVKGSLDRFRDLIYVDDVVNAVKIFLNQKWQKHFSVYNVSNGYPVMVSEMLDAIQIGLNQELPIQEVSGTPGDQHGIFGSSYSLQREFNWKPQVKHQEGIDKMIQWASSKQ